MIDPLDRIEFVLVKPQHGRNIGQAARAMKNMGFSRLVLVAPPKGWRRGAKLMAMHADDVIRKARIVKTISAAVKDAVFIVGTTRRGGEARSPRRLTSETAALILKKSTEGAVAVLFGNERVGLSAAELSASNLNIHIRTSPRQPSLNLSHAVLIVAYDLFGASGAVYWPVRQKDRDKYRPTEAHLEEMCALIRPALEKLGYRNGVKRPFLEHLLDTIKGTARKSGFEMKDIRMIEGVARRIMDLNIKSSADIG